MGTRIRMHPKANEICDAFSWVDYTNYLMQFESAITNAAAVGYQFEDGRIVYRHSIYSQIWRDGTAYPVTIQSGQDYVPPGRMSVQYCH